MIHYIVDAYNVIFKGFIRGYPDEHSIELGRQRFVSAITHMKGTKQISLTLVFDCHNPDFIPPMITPISGITTIYATPPDTADTRIIQIIRHMTHTKHIIVVSSDHEIISPARKMGIRVVSSEEFLELLHKKTRQGHKPSAASLSRSSDDSDDIKPQTASNAEIDYYLKRFEKQTEGKQPS